MLPDVNVWIALTFEAHQHHRVAAAWLNSVGDDDRIYFCDVTQQALLRLATYLSLSDQGPLSMQAAWAVYDAFQADPRIEFCQPVRREVEPKWRTLTSQPTSCSKLWTDALIAATGLVEGLQVVTFDQGFPYPAGLDVLSLSDH